ncbi:hypothetical protein B0H12DRAFT_1326241 [Mycena haematopus]|nr:hypothetical protein B0H12DRAFT_1326241 [Mycena haematopus]
MSTSQDAVISTPELLELTLSHLPIRDLLITAPLVSKTWQAIILTPALQRALFFQPDPSYRAERVRNPLLVEIFRPFFSEVSYRWPNAEAIKSMPWSKAPSAFKRPEASWRRMLVAQPPPQTMLVTETRHARLGSYVRRAVIDDEPLRMGALYDITLPFVDRVASSFCVRWHHDDNSESDITLEAVYAQQCNMAPRPVLDMHFYSTRIRQGHNLSFGEWSENPRSPTPESPAEDSDEEGEELSVLPCVGQ